MIPGNPGRLLVPVLFAVTLGACLTAPASGAITSRLVAANTADSGVAVRRSMPAARMDNPSAAASRPSGNAPSTTVPPLTCIPTERLMAACRPCLPIIDRAPSIAFCPPCPPVFTEGPRPAIGCPTPIPPLPPTKRPAGQPAIVFCLAPPVGPQPGFRSGIVCGSGFHPDEQIRLTVSSSRGGLSWISRSDSAGHFRILLPPSLCQLAPFSLVATGNAGDRSNALTISADACRLLP